MVPASHAARFRTGLLDPAAPVPAGLTDHAGRAVEARYAVYRNNVTASLTDAVESVFPAVAAVVGRDFFRAMTRDYLRARPPRSRVLTEYGHDFADFVAGFGPAAGLPFLPDLARLERAWLDAYVAADAAPLGLDRLAAVPAEALDDVAFTPHPALRLVSSSWAVAALFASNRADPPRAPEIPVTTAQAVMVTRPAMAVLVTPLPVPALRLVERLATGATLGLAATATLAEHPDLDLGAALGLALGNGAFTAIA